MNKLLRQIKDFSLIEIMLVVVIMGMLASVSIPLAEIVVNKNRREVTLDNVGKLRDALDNYKKDQGHYPPITGTETAHEVLQRELVKKGYLREIPANPYTGSPKDWEIRDSVNSGWIPIAQNVKNDKETIYGSSTATSTLNVYSGEATDVSDVRVPPMLQTGLENE